MFRDRHDAGQRLAEALSPYQNAKDTLVLCLPRGGVVVGYEMSFTLQLPLDVLVTRKLGTPANPELAMGALTETGYRHLNEDVINELGITSRQIEEEVERQEHEIQRRVALYRRGEGLPHLTGQTVILVDDGIATGATFFASLMALRAANVKKLIAAIPVAPPGMPNFLGTTVDEIVILATPTPFFAIGQFYENFSQVEDEEVVHCLNKIRMMFSSTGSTQQA